MEFTKVLDYYEKQYAELNRRFIVTALEKEEAELNHNRYIRDLEKQINTLEEELLKYTTKDE